LSREAEEKIRLVPVGRIVRTHGVRGALKIFPYGETLAATSPGETLLLQAAEQGGESELTVAELRPQAKLWIGRFKEVPTVDDALRVCGSELFIPEDRLPPLEEGEFYHFQLIGLTAETEEGRVLGVVREIMETGGNDVYVLEGEGGELLVPAIEEVVLRIDLDRKRMVLRLPEGLE
jgi:16S rRNA processing protein RimM